MLLQYLVISNHLQYVRLTQTRSQELHYCKLVLGKNILYCTTVRNKIGEGEVTVFSAKRWDRRSRADLIKPTTPCHDTQVVGPWQVQVKGSQSSNQLLSDCSGCKVRRLHHGATASLILISFVRFLKSPVSVLQI